jgi:hypothetical protein
MDNAIDSAWGCVQRVAAGLLGEIWEWRRWKEELQGSEYAVERGALGLRDLGMAAVLHA